ncbi:DNA polymerase III subunit delta [Lactobacillus sp. LL6]|uniref:DNA polymerase III subunit delta n=1 Tax=Lactobacillus sp. LL6 TaxID=2596827 RepID=UPI001185AAD2|nr:DNA polymerase III subunit delta [Lactobacillus sp. LL6]TSO25899.1 DNA polymerase III subunit delta [Lactobacillus sp. LL6]
MVDITKINNSQADFLKRAYENKQLTHSYLFVDNDEDEALNTAYWLACLFNCSGEVKPDGKCRNCQQIISVNHPDVLLVDSEGKNSLSIDQIRPLKEELAKSPVESSRRFFFIKEAEKLTLSAANALLNLLEEPVAPVVSILITNNADQILPTIRSRVQVLNFNEGKTAKGKTEILLENGFSNAEIEELGNTKNLDQLIKYFYQEMLEGNSLSLVNAHRLGEVKLVSQRKYILLNLKLWAQKDLNNDRRRLVAAKMLKYLIEADKMQASNVNFRNVLDYLALKWKR